ncbi:hypothetical protein J2W21_001218 [Sinomonas atrocyanea]|uniref:hypothetical protein n=1 Tax=Sinomonas atrocyanea TaxID=37927 RepID=UPI0027860908|nr:hypothetical protein [Sinomonas atrocyanea]MDP9883724.1 hypothetical protein [Sinomonas atrocyanea]
MKHARKLSTAAAALLLTLTGCAGAAQHGTALPSSAGASATPDATPTATKSPAAQHTAKPTTAPPSTAAPTAAAPVALPAPSAANRPVAPAPAAVPVARIPAPAAPKAPAVVHETGTVVTTAYTTGYGYWDNTPAGSAEVSHPIVHKTAGGTGTWADPVTVAVGHSITGGVDTLDYPAGTRLYIPNLQKYLIVEDTCGDGATPQDGPCHSGAPAGTTVWFDVWIGGSSGTQAAADACGSTLTDANGAAHTVIVNPSVRTYKVTPGDVLSGGACHANYGNTPLAQ